ncbi:hypothetical protein JCM24511_08730 [Saitozyma sp. JCM 24511]|nr:hypothetical protein JCM24511_08730 [Saitozyma sp. JCM 24511]
MSPRKKPAGMHIALPPRVSLALSQCSDSSPSTPSPHTPSPYEYEFSPDVEERRIQVSMLMDDESSGVGIKRTRDEEEAVEQVWTEEEVGQLQATLLHPFRPLSVHYPPGELPPKDALDELTHQIVRYAFRSSPVKRTTPVVHQPASSPPDSPSKFDLSSSVMLEECSSHGTSPETSSNRPDGWTHSWDATRQKLFELALEESKFGHDAYDRRMPRAERQTRPGLRRVDSMDFLDQAEEEERPADTIGRTLRLSTSLQNSSKSELVLGMSRSPSLGSLSESPAPLAKHPNAPSIAAITLTPASPPAHPPSQPMRRRGSIRSNSGGSRPARPSLLQRGRSFTASDLQAEANQPDSPTSPSSPTKTDHTGTASPNNTSPASTPSLHIPPVPALQTSPRLTRSQSSTYLAHPAHLSRDTFLSHHPTTSDRSALAVPFHLNVTATTTANQPKSNGWSDSEDESANTTPRVVKKIKAGGGPRRRRKLDEVVAGAVIDAGGLRSPFEEKCEIRF